MQKIRKRDRLPVHYEFMGRGGCAFSSFRFFDMAVKNPPSVSILPDPIRSAYP
jgi:hypothetical protein